MKKQISLLFILVAIFSYMPTEYASAGDDTCVELIQQYYTAIDANDWENSFRFWCREENEDLEAFYHYTGNVENHIGIFNIQRIQLIDVQEIQDQKLFSVLPRYDIYANLYGNDIKAYLCQTDSTVYSPDKYYRNGIDFSLLLFARENGEWKIIMESSPTPNFIEYAYPEETRDSNTKKVLELIDLRMQGIWADMNGKMIEINRYGLESYQNFSKSLTYIPDAFQDMDENAWYGLYGQNIAKKAYEYGIMTGKNADTLDPDGMLRIAEAIKISATIHNIYWGGQTEFLKSDIWYDTYVEYAIENGIISENDFSDYTQAISRSALAYIFANTLPRETLKQFNSISNLPDVFPQTQYYEEILFLYQAGILIGVDSEKSFQPKKEISRMEAAALILRLIDPLERIYLFKG